MQQTRLSFSTHKLNNGRETWVRFFFTTANRSSKIPGKRKCFRNQQTAAFRFVARDLVVSSPTLPLVARWTLRWLDPWWRGQNGGQSSELRSRQLCTGEGRSPMGSVFTTFGVQSRGNILYKLTQHCSIQTLCQSWVGKKVLKELTLSTTLLST